ncbi:phage head-binding domain-containing protein [Escherichia coli]|uniref:phage head-binding domain-containing protein n=1 Tax=Escherichia coli TaxID=562 RepID=UPI0038B681B8
MTNITANVVVSMPSQLFTMARSFKAVANGKIYIGKIDTDPVNPENQIQVYVENEDGSHVPVSQPIIINAAGYPVYNGQIAKFVTVQGHSMAVYDAYGAQQFYFPNVLKYDPDQLSKSLAGPDGTENIGYEDGTLKDKITSIDDEFINVRKSIDVNFVTSIIPPTSPTITTHIKAIVKDENSNDFYIISKRCHGKGKYISHRVTNEVSPSDSNNYGGASPFRPGSVYMVSDAVIAKLSPHTKSDTGVSLSSFTESQISTLYGFSKTDDAIHAETEQGDFTLNTPQVYSISTNAYVTYRLTNSIAHVRLACSNASSKSVTISISRNNADWITQKIVDTKTLPGGQPPLPIDIEINGLGGTWYLKVENTDKTTLQPANLVGLNVFSLGCCELLDYDNFIATITPFVNGEPSYYFGGNGATEFAAKELSTGKFFGTYHGGHSDFLQRLRTENASYNLDSGYAPKLLLSRHVTLHTASTLRVSSSTYSYVAETIFGDGANVTNYAINKTSGDDIICERVYTHMATSARNFNWIHLPILIRKEDDGDVVVGQCGFMQQFRAIDASTINCYFSQVNMSDNGYGGGYISFQQSYNKQYYGPIFSSVNGARLPEGMFTTGKEFF